MTIRIEDTYRAIEVDLWGHLYETIDIPRSKARKADELMMKAQEQSEREDGDDAIVELIGQMLDIKLRSADEKGTKPSTLIKRKWKADELTVRQLFGFLGQIGQEESGELDNRPT